MSREIAKRVYEAPAVLVDEVVFERPAGSPCVTIEDEFGDPVCDPPGCGSPPDCAPGS